MRVPFIINKNTQKAYVPSQEALSLLGEVGRLVLTENFEWDKDLSPPLTAYCVETICKSFKDRPLLDELPCPDRNYLLEILPTDLPLDLVIPLITDDYYWERRYQDEFGVVLYRKHPDWTWKCLFIERYMQKVVEEAQPQYEDEFQMNGITTLCTPYVHRLTVSQLQAWKPPLTFQKQDIPEVYPTDHIDFAPIFEVLQNIEELSVTYGMNCVADSFNWNMVKLSVDDCRNLGSAVLKLPLLTVLRITRSKLEYFHIQQLMHGLIKNKTLLELDLSHSQIEDRGALCISKVLIKHPTLEILNLCNNRIGTVGGQGLGFALLHEDCCPLYRLDMRLNPLKHDGTMGILRALIRGTKLEELSLAACQFEDETAIRTAQMIKLNISLKKLDLSNNWFDEEGGIYLVDSMSVNRTLHWLDVRETDITPGQQRSIKRALIRNRLGVDEVEESIDEFAEEMYDYEMYEYMGLADEDEDEDEEEEEEGHKEGEVTKPKDQQAPVNAT